MANNLLLSDVGANAGISGIVALLNSGFMDIMSGAQPATGNTPITSQVKLAGLTFAATAFGAAAAGVVVANAIGSDSDNDNTGTATWARLYKSDHTTGVLDLSVGTAGCDINLDSVAIIQHGTTALSSFTLALPE